MINSQQPPFDPYLISQARNTLTAALEKPIFLDYFGQPIEKIYYTPDFYGAAVTLEPFFTGTDEVTVVGLIGVLLEYRGTGLGSELFNEVLRDHPGGLVLRTHMDRKANGFYSSRCKGPFHMGDTPWNIYWTSEEMPSLNYFEKVILDEAMGQRI
ncbi:hypothetical protein JXC34_01600 [Candidatus Woesearchaeota archaeon]|nr:hypothetical protein [Candidatus Woesearchaeota archaeon]